MKAKSILVAKKGSEKKETKAVAATKKTSSKVKAEISKTPKAPAKKVKATEKSVAKTAKTQKVVAVKKTSVVVAKKTTKGASAKNAEIQPVVAEPVKVSSAPPTPRNKVKSILVTQPKPESEKSPYYDLAKKCNVKVDFREFIHVEPIPATEFRRDRINILDYTAVIFTSRNAADHYFRMCQEMRITVPETMKYFCISESTAYYLQKYVIFRKRKIFHGKQSFADMMDVIKKHKDDKFLLPCTDIANVEGSELLEKAKIRYAKAVS